MDYLNTEFTWEVIQNEAADYKIRNEMRRWGIPPPPTQYLFDLQAIFDEEPSDIHDKCL